MIRTIFRTVFLIFALMVTSVSNSGDHLTAGTEFQDCDECPIMVVLPAGSYMMGSPESEEGREDHEGPRHLVTFDKPFAMGKFEVTFGEWDACVNGGGCAGHQAKDRWGRGQQPVNHISWDEAHLFTKWISEKTGKEYRLPSESEWEYAARAGTTTPFSTGETISTDQANYEGEYAYGPGKVGEYREKTLPVGSFPPNQFGLHDMHGNVWEWIEDCYHPTYEGAPDHGRAWISRVDTACDRAVIRGGSWHFGPNFARSAYRSNDFGHHRNYNLYIGFRVARTLEP